MSHACRDLLVEVGTEELPPKALKGLSDALARIFGSELAERGLTFGGVEAYATPRRLGLLVRQLVERQPDQEIVRRGPSLAASFGEEGRPTQAALGFARSCGVAVEELDRERSRKGEWLQFRRRTPGAETLTLIASLLGKSLAALPIPKRMRWGDGEAEFVRPIHWVCVLFGEQPINGQVMGVPVAPTTRGHRFHHPQPIAIRHAADYPSVLRTQGHVEPSFEARKRLIQEQVSRLCESEGLVAQVDPELLDEVTALVEWPVPVLGEFEKEFLSVPEEALIETMQANQKYFPVRRRDGNLANRFVAVANIESSDPTQVRAGNERVIRPRFADARFFWEQDIKRPLQSLAPKLEGVVFQERLGSLGDKSRRVGVLARFLAESTGGVAVKLVERAAILAKCDLVSTMVYEFPSLQGTMGRYYAAHAGEDPCVSAALEEQYLPRSAGDRLPETQCGRLLGLADRLDTLVGIFGIGEKPTGTKDPYGLRRASIGILRILIETPLELDLRIALERAAAVFPEGTLAAGTVESVLEYVLERLEGYYQDKEVPGDRVEAVLAIGETTPSRLNRRVVAVHRFGGLPEGEALIAANKRIRNLLGKGEMEDVAVVPPDPALFESRSEEGLWEAVQGVEAHIGSLLEAQDFDAALLRLAALREHVDRFFADVMVMVEDPRLRANRCALLGRVLALFRQVAEVSYLR